MVKKKAVGKKVKTASEEVKQKTPLIIWALGVVGFLFFTVPAFDVLMSDVITDFSLLGLVFLGLYLLMALSFLFLIFLKNWARMVLIVAAFVFLAFYVFTFIVGIIWVNTYNVLLSGVLYLVASVIILNTLYYNKDIKALFCKNDNKILFEEDMK